MELFKNKDLKKEYKDFISSTIFTIFKCKYCNLESCTLHYIFDCSCENCRIIRCKERQKFNIQLEALIKGATSETRCYISNFVQDFFKLNDITLKFFFDFSNKSEIDIDELKHMTLKLRKFCNIERKEVVKHLQKTTCNINNNRKSKITLKYKL